MRPLRGLQETRVATREESGVLGFPSRRGLTPRGSLDSVVSDSLRPHESQHTRPPCPSPILEFTQTLVHQVSDAIQPFLPGEFRGQKGLAGCSPWGQNKSDMTE